MLDPRRLEVLREFAAQGTIARAAGVLAFTPSAVSQQLAQLQREAGVELFRKVGRRLELTDAGRMLVSRADGLLAHVEGIEAELAAFSGRLRGTVRVGAFQTAAQAVVLPALDRLADVHPELRMELREHEAEESLPLVTGGGLEVAIAEEYEHAPRPRLPQLHREYLPDDEMLLALPRRHEALRAKGPLPLAVGSRARLGLGTRGHRLRRHVRPGLPLARRLRAGDPAPRLRHGAAARPGGARVRGDSPRPRATGARPPGGGASHRGRHGEPRDIRGRPDERPRPPVHGRGRRGTQANSGITRSATSFSCPRMSGTFCTSSLVKKLTR